MIINTASVAAFDSQIGQAAYSALDGVVGMTTYSQRFGKNGRPKLIPLLRDIVPF